MFRNFALLCLTAVLAFVASHAIADEQPNPLDQIKDDLFRQNLLKGQLLQSDIDRLNQRIEDYMVLSGSRLNEDDPGKTTQDIQRQIVRDLADLALASRQAKQTPPPSTKPSSSGGNPPNPGGERPANAGNSNTRRNPGNQPATVERIISGSGNADARDFYRPDLSGVWGKTVDRIRGAVIDSPDEGIVEKYADYIRRYYEAIAVRATERR
jgi:hypothetical protein